MKAFERNNACLVTVCKNPLCVKVYPGYLVREGVIVGFCVMLAFKFSEVAGERIIISTVEFIRYQVIQVDLSPLIFWVSVSFTDGLDPSRSR